MSLVLSMPNLQCLGYLWITPEYTWLSLKCLNMPKYTQICMSMPRSAWMAFLFTMSPLQSLVCMNVWLLISAVCVWRNIGTVFLKSQYLIFFYLQVRFQICCYLLGPREPRGVNFDIPFQSSRRISITMETFILQALILNSLLSKGLKWSF